MNPRTLNRTVVSLVKVIPLWERDTSAELANALPTEILVNEIILAGGVKQMDMSPEAVAQRERAAERRAAIRRMHAAIAELKG